MAASYHHMETCHSAFFSKNNTIPKPHPKRWRLRHLTCFRAARRWWRSMQNTVTHSEWNRSRNLPHHLFHVLIWMEGWGRISHDRTDKWQMTSNVSHLELGVQVSIRGYHILILLLARGFDEDLFGLPEFLLHPSHDRAVLAKQGPAATQHVPPKTVGPQWVVPGYQSHTWMIYVWLTIKCIHTRPSLDSTVFDL